MCRPILLMAATVCVCPLRRPGGITLKLQQRLAHNELHLEEILADAGYSNGINYAFLEQRKITDGPPRGWIPGFGKYKPQIEGFSYNPEEDHFICSEGKRLPFKTFDRNVDGGLLKVYRAAYQDCQQCPLKPTCVPKSKCRQIIRRPMIRTIDEPYSASKVSEASA